MSIRYPLKLARPPRPDRNDFLARPGDYGRTLYNPEGRHLAADIAAALGTEAVSVLPLTITHASRYGDLGRVVAGVDARYGYEWWCAHLSRITVEVGDRVRRGQQLGDIGHSGNATGNHLHLVVLAEPLRGRAWGSVPFIDPYPFLLEAWREHNA